MAMNGKILIHTVHCNKCNAVFSGADIGNMRNSYICREL